MKASQKAAMMLKRAAQAAIKFAKVAIKATVEAVKATMDASKQNRRNRMCGHGKACANIVVTDGGG